MVDNNHGAILHELFYGLGSTSDPAVVQRCHERWIDCFNRPRGALLLLMFRWPFISAASDSFT